MEKPSVTPSQGDASVNLVILVIDVTKVCDFVILCISLEMFTFI